MEVLADGAERNGRRGDDPRRDEQPVARRAVCSCGWRSERLHPLPERPAEPHPRPPAPQPPAWEQWFDALEAADDACHADWELAHFDPLLGYEPHTQLIEATDQGGRRHFLDGQPVHAGATLELLLPEGKWLAGRYEWSYKPGEPPTFHVLLGGPPEAERQDAVPIVAFDLPPRAVLRWPERKHWP